MINEQILLYCMYNYFIYTFRCYGNRQSLEARKRERLAMCFESFEEAKIRNETKLEQNKKSPVGKFENMHWDKQAMVEEVNSYTNDTLVNWSELARRYEVKNKSGELAKNGGQIVKEYLKFQGVNVSKFRKRVQEDNTGGRVRKRMKRSAGGEVTVPCPVTNDKLKKKLTQKILSGEYSVGELIVPRQVRYKPTCYIMITTYYTTILNNYNLAV